MRHVILTGSYAIKFPRLRNIAVERLAYDLAGFRANQQERRRWRDALPAEKSRLCPVLFGDPLGVLLVMKRAQPLSDEEWGELLELDMAEVNLPRHRRFYDGDLKRENYGTIKGKIVRLDYGDPVRS